MRGEAISISTRLSLAIVLGLAACGGSGGGGDGDGDGDGDAGDGDGGMTDSPDAGPPGGGDDLDTATGCAGIYNPDQVLEFHLTMEPGDWSHVQNDCTFMDYRPAQMQCGDGTSIEVGVRHKRSGGTQKPGLKIDVNFTVVDQEFQGLKKMSWENGVGSSVDGCGTDDGSAGSLLSEYLGWRLHVLSGAITGRAAFINVTMNGEPLGVFLNVEQIDKRFLRTFVGDNDGWLYKVSGGDGDGLQTNEGTDDPYDDYFCFLQKNPCALPANLESELPDKLDIPQLLTVGGVNAVMANHDAIMLKLNNYLSYDWAGPRMYFPWDLDSTMQDDYDVFTGTVPGGVTVFKDALFPTWEEDYDQILTELLAGPLSLEAIEGELDRAVEVAGPAIDDDPMLGGAASASSSLKSYWQDRHPAVVDQVEAH